ncbi:MAG: Ig-like domain-containing protein [Actinomycetota bacterium]|nr:Ig-like domain-containing protein [Actinomycetota bacterium]
MVSRRMWHRMVAILVTAASMGIGGQGRAGALTDPPFARAEAMQGILSSPDLIAVADVTGDGRNDVVVTTAGAMNPRYDQRLYVLAQGADGRLATPQMYETDLKGTPDGRSYVRWGLGVGDLDGDGLTDVAVATDDGVDVFLQRNGTFAPRRLIPAPQANEVDVADIDGDGRADLVVNGGSGTSWLRGTGGGDFGTARTIVAQNQMRGRVEIADMTGDGRPDVVAYSFFLQNNVFLQYVNLIRQLPDGTFAPPVQYDAYSSISVGDFNGDGRPDITSVRAARLAMLAGASGGAVDSGTCYDTAYEPGTQIAADVNGDGRTDLIQAHIARYLGLYIQNPDGTFAPEEKIPTPYDDTHPEGSIAVGDVNSDGRADIVYTDGYIYVVYGLPSPPPSTASFSKGASCGLQPPPRPFGPTVLEAKPWPGTTDARPSSVVWVNFSEPMRRYDTEAAFTLRKKGSATNVEGSFAWNLDSTELTFTPSADLVDGASYTFQISGTAIGSSTVPLNPYSSTLIVKPIPPTVSAIEPAGATTGVAAGANVVVTFSEAVDRNSAQAAFSLRRAGTTANLGGAFSWNPASTVMSFDPYANLAAAGTYNVALAAGVKDLAGNPAPAAFTSSFAVDATAPFVVSLDPASGSLNLPRAAVATVTFSEPVDRSSAQAAFSMREPGMAALGGTFSWNPASTVMTFDPYGDLAAGVYTFAVAGSVRDLSGNVLLGPASSVFSVW